MSESELHYRLLSYLATERDLRCWQMKNPRHFHYQGMPDFVLREGQFFEPRALPAGIEYLAIRHCYRNAFRTALEERYVYVEGYAVSASHELPILHAWNLDRDGFVVDRTWNPHGQVYFGVVFPLAVVPIERGKHYPVIDDWEHGFPILRRSWDREASSKQAFEELNV